jgi:LmbE family N-acetylglucosaminyl deacetylase
MPPHVNPAKLNPLQLRTLTLLQAIARIPEAARQEADGHVVLTQFPHAHGDHFHLGDATVATADATGLENEAVWNALVRKGMIRAEYPHRIALTPQGLSYDTGLAGQILHHGGHH